MRSSFRQWPRHLQIVLLVSLVIGLAERIVWAVVRKNGSATGEAFNVAVAIAKGRGLADPFFDGQGPTAHFLPIPPGVAGGVYALFGIQSATSEAILLVLSLGLCFGSYWLLGGYLRRLGVSLACTVYGFAFLCLAPIYTGMEVFDYRVWEGGMAVMAAVIFLRLLVSPEMSGRRRALIAAFPALIFFINPIMGIAAGCALAIWLWRQSRAAWLRSAAIFIATFLLLFGPWTVRNAIVMGEPIWLRDNLGLELAVANFPGAVMPADPKAMFDGRLEEVHPFVGVNAYLDLKDAGGEIGYSRQMKLETVAWMQAHPGDVALIWARHLRELLLPPPWYFQTARGVVFPYVRSAMICATHLLGFVGLLLLWRRDPRRTAQLLPFVLLPILAYIPFQPITRYTWLYYTPLAYAAAVAVDAGLRRFASRKAAIVV